MLDFRWDGAGSALWTNNEDESSVGLPGFSKNKTNVVLINQSPSPKAGWEALTAVPGNPGMWRKEHPGCQHGARYVELNSTG